MSRNVWDSRLDVSCMAVEKQQESVAAKIKSCKCNHDSTWILSSWISSTRSIVMVLFLGFVALLLRPHGEGQNNNWFPDWSSPCRSNSWQQKKEEFLAHETHMLCCVCCFLFYCRILFAFAQHGNPDRIAKVETRSKSRRSLLPF